MPGKKSNEENFKLLNDVEHVMKRPDTYVGSLDGVDTECWIYNEKTNSIEYSKIEYVAGLYKIFDEVLVNSIDHATRCHMDPDCKNKVTKIKVTIKDNTISVFNDGEGIPVAVHKEHKMHIPEMIFGFLPNGRVRY